jgi:DNA-binding MarR family transcriptional regulator
MEQQQAEISVNTMINKLSSLFDYINKLSETHDQLLNQYLSEHQCKFFQKNQLQNLMFSEFHVIDCIGKNHLPNATFIAKELNMTKGAISKITSKLLEKELITANRLENNKREIYYALTGRGKEVFEIHKKLHEMKREKMVAIFERYHRDEWLIIGKFLDDLIRDL